MLVNRGMESRVHCELCHSGRSHEMSTSIAAGSITAPSLVRYNVASVKDLPENANATGILSDGSVYVEPYKMLTGNDQTFLKSATGESFDSVTISAEQAAGTFKGNALAAAIGWDRATGVLSGDVDSSYLKSIETALSAKNNTNGYEGFQITTPDISQAFAAIDATASSKLDVSA